MDELEKPTRNITGVFFVQTHAAIRGGSRAGRGIIGETHERGHILAIHTTVVGNHPTLVKPDPHNRYFYHTAMKERGVLAESLQNGKDQIEGATATKDEDGVVVKPGVVVEFVRPPAGVYNTDVIQTYEDLNLEHVYWNIDPERGDDGTPGGLRDNIERQMKRYLPDMKKNPNATPKEQMVALFHDVQGLVANHIGSYIGKIEGSSS